MYSRGGRGKGWEGQGVGGVREDGRGARGARSGRGAKGGRGKELDGWKGCMC